MKQRFVKVSCYLIFILIVFFTPTSIQAEIQQPPVCEQLVINLLQPSIQEYFNQYFGQALSKQIQLYNYEMSIIEMKKEDDKPPTVKIKVTPMIGAHNPVADYELVIVVENLGDVIIEAFKTLKIYQETIQRYHLTLPN